MLELSAFDYELPNELIAQHPPSERGQSRLLVLDRATGETRFGMFADFAGHIGRGDALVLNDTRVFPCRIRARKGAGGAEIEVFLVRELKGGLWEALVRPGKRVTVGTVLTVLGARQCDTAEVVADHGATKTLKFNIDDVRRLCWRLGEMPLPPYIKRGSEESDKDRYQTVFARSEGAVAAPTAGLHFSSEMLRQLREAGVFVEFVTLHTGLGTFQPLRCEQVEKNTLDAERYQMTVKTAQRLNAVRRQGRKVFAAGTTTFRLLETVMDETGEYRSGEGMSDIFIYPGYQVRSADALLTNFHLPRSSLLLLVCAFAGRDLILRAYEAAVKEKFRFYSYGDAMLII
jgi:S-adenosylmethionine:tRNA ribosyltransferase-isomerase